MLFGLIHYNAPGDNLADFLAYAAKAGFDSVELQISDVWPETGKPEVEAEKVAAMLFDNGLKCSALAAGNDFNVIEEDEVKAQVERFEMCCNLALIVGAPVIRTEGGGVKESVPEDLWVDAITGCVWECLDFVEEMGLILAIDNHGWITNNVDVLAGILETIDHPQVGTNLDTMNYRWYGYPVETLPYIFDRVAQWVKHTHFKDGKGFRDTYVGGALGTGEVPIGDAVAALKANGYQGVWCAEYEGARDVSDQGYRDCLAWLKENC
jgi:sugar phosphate isomerase/epimerase